MAVHLNRVLPNAHFRKRKTWAKLAKTHFNQPAKKVARRAARASKAASAQWAESGTNPPRAPLYGVIGTFF